jgi:hypothetical protein
MKRIIAVIALFIAVGCNFTLSTGPTGDTANQTTSAQTLMPNIAGYTRTNADSITDAITAVGGGASLISGNPALAAGIAKIDSMIQCYQDVGAVAANVYTQTDIGTVLQGQIPRVGAVAVVNQDRLSRNFLNCALGNQNQGFSAQSAAIEPCFGGDTFTKNGETITYVFAATDPSLCTAFQQHFDAVR